MGWLADRSFSVYRGITSKFVARGFRTQEVYSLEPPDDERVELVPYDSKSPVASIPRLFEVSSFPRADRAAPRLRRIRAGRVMTRAVSRLKVGGMPAAPSDHAALMEAIYPSAYREVWPHPPVVPPELGETRDRLAALAVAGPFADYVRRIRGDDLARINALEADHAEADDYVIELEALARHPVKDGLHPIGCTVLLRPDPGAGKLVTRSVVYRGEVHHPGGPSWRLVEKVALCSLSTHLTIIKHNVYIHLIFITVHASAAINMLGTEHPIRRLLHHCFHTALIGNYEIGQFQIRGPECFCTKLFSFDYPTMIAVVNEYCDSFDVATMDPEADFRARGVAGATFAYPYRDDVEKLWRVVRRYVGSYVDHYFPDDDAVAADGELRRWYDELERRLPGGIAGYAPVLDRETVKGICASLVHTSTVTHDNVNNVVWNYTTHSQYVPTVVPENGEEPPVDVAFDFLTTLIGTFKPYNMLLDGISTVALDSEGVRIMDEFVATLRGVQAELERGGRRLDGIYPENLNYSVSN